MTIPPTSKPNIKIKLRSIIIQIHNKQTLQSIILPLSRGLRVSSSHSLLLTNHKNKTKMKQLFSLLIATLLLSCHKDNSNKIEPFTVKDNNKMVIRFEGSNVMTDSIGVLSKLEVVRKVAHSSSQNTQDTIYVSVTKYVHF